MTDCLFTKTRSLIVKFFLFLANQENQDFIDKYLFQSIY